MAKVFVVDDDGGIVEFIKAALPHMEHEVVLTATSRDEAVKMAGEAFHLGVEVAFVDGDLKSGAGGTEEGEAVATALRQRAPGVKVVAFTAQPDGRYGDVYLGKPARLAEIKSAIETALKLGQK